MQVERIASLESRLSAEQEKLGRLGAKLEAARGRSQASTPGGLTDYDPAILSGTRRRPNHRAEDRRYAAYDREAAASRAAQDQERTVKSLKRQLERAKADAEAPHDLASLEPGSFVRDRWGWHRVVRVSKKSVSVETGYSWTERIPLEKIIETRDGGQS